jgi:hypothetical protein
MRKLSFEWCVIRTLLGALPSLAAWTCSRSQERCTTSLRSLFERLWSSCSIACFRISRSSIRSIWAPICSCMAAWPSLRTLRRVRGVTLAAIVEISSHNSSFFFGVARRWFGPSLTGGGWYSGVVWPKFLIVGSSNSFCLLRGQILARFHPARMLRSVSVIWRAWVYSFVKTTLLRC